jgi:2-iminobutanoate/2-iminopropanoate deaminase
MPLEKLEVKSSEAPKAVGPYSQAIKVKAPVLVFLSGQVGVDPASGEFVSDTVEGQARRCLENLMAVLRQAGGDAASIVKATVYITRMEDFAVVNHVYASFFTEPYPARVTVAVRELPLAALVEIEAIAALEG